MEGDPSSRIEEKYRGVVPNDIFMNIAGAVILAFQKENDFKKRAWLRSEIDQMIEIERNWLITEKQISPEVVDDAIQFGITLAHE